MRRGGAAHHLGRFSSEGVAAALAQGATMVFGVPTMYHRLAADAEGDAAIARRAAAGRGCSSPGSAALPAVEHERIERLSGQRIVERYGMSETLMNTAIRADGERRAGSVGPPLEGVEIRLLDDDGAPIDAADDETIGEIAVRGPNLFLEYLNRPDATAEAVRDGWFAPATSPRARRTATSASSGGARPTSSRAAATRSARARSRARCSSTPASPRPRSPASPTPTSASGSSPGSSPPRARRRRPTSWPTTSPRC